MMTGRGYGAVEYTFVTRPVIGRGDRARAGFPGQTARRAGGVRASPLPIATTKGFRPRNQLWREAFLLFRRAVICVGARTERTAGIIHSDRVLLLLAARSEGFDPESMAC